MLYSVKQNSINLKLNEMKKQILIFTFFVAAVLVGTNALAQTYVMEPTAAPGCITPEVLSGCTADELHPVQGETYSYNIATTVATDVVRWFVVNNTAMEAASEALVDPTLGVLAAGNTNIDNGLGTDPYILSVVNGTYDGAGAPASTNSTIELQWKYFDGVTEEILLVAYVESDPTCTDNIAVYRIIPTPAFTVDIASVNEAGANPAGPSDTPNEECVSPIESAVYDGQTTTPADMLTVDYGENWAFFVVNGANYFDSWMPEFQISYDAGAPLAVEAEWAYLGDATSGVAANWNALTGTLGGTWTSGVPVIAGASAASPGSVGGGAVPAPGGECIVVRVRLDWGTNVEHDQSNGTLTVAANGVAYDGVGTTTAEYFDDRTNFEDLMNTPGGTGTDCTPDGFSNDVVDYIITPRPQVEENTDPQQEDKTGEGVN